LIVHVRKPVFVRLALRSEEQTSHNVTAQNICHCREESYAVEHFTHCVCFCRSSTRIVWREWCAFAPFDRNAWHHRSTPLRGHENPA
jgi:hypothetical protein